MGIFTILGWVFTVLVLIFLAYMYLMGTIYVPGCVAQLDPSDIDSPELVKLSDDHIWHMPNGFQVYHFRDEDHSSKDSEPVLCLHGGPGMPNTRPWLLSKSVAAQSSYHLHFFHARGCGRSTRPFFTWPTRGRIWSGLEQVEAKLGLKAQILDIERARVRLGVDKIRLMGHSFGAFVATLYAAEFPDHVQSLVLLSPATVLKIPPPAGELDLIDRVSTILKEKGKETLLKEFDDWKNRYFMLVGLTKSTDRSLAELQHEFGKFYLTAMALHNNQDPNHMPDHIKQVDISDIGGMAAFAPFFSMGMFHDYRHGLEQRLREAPFQTVIVDGTKDICCPAGEQYVRLFPSGKVQYVQVESDHFMMEDPDAVENLAHFVVNAQDAKADTN